MRPRFRAAAAALLGVLGAGALLSGCSSLGIGGPDATLHVLAGSEVADMQPILDEMEAETGVRLELEFTGTLDGTEQLLDATNDAAPWQATWFPSNSYLSLFPERDVRVAQEQSIMRSPVVLGIKPDVADGLGWQEGAQPAWADVVDAIDAGDLSYGMTSPVSSNSGFTTLVQAATALSGTGTVLEPADIAEVTEPLTRFAGGQQLTSGSSGWLSEKFTDDPTAVDAIFNYESVIAQMRVDGEPLRTIVPSDGSITSDYPLSLLSSASDAQSEAYRTAVEYLTSDEVQQRIADETHRRTTATPADAAQQVFELPFPAQLDTVQTLLDTWLSDVRKPANMAFAIDTSGSMDEDERMDDLREALRTLSGQQTSEAAGFLTLKPREHIAFIEFAHAEKSRLDVDVPADDAGLQGALDEINAQIDGYSPGGGTEIYGTLQAALTEAADAADDSQLTSVVLFSDGRDEGAVGRDGFEAWYAQHPEIAGIPVYVIAFAEADLGEMEALADLTGGRAFEVGDDSLAGVFREIRGYL